MLDWLIDKVNALRVAGFVYSGSPLRARRVLIGCVLVLMLVLLIAGLYNNALRGDTPFLILLVALVVVNMIAQPCTGLLTWLDRHSPRPFWMRWGSKLSGSLISVGVVALLAGTFNSFAALVFGVELVSGLRFALLVPFWAELSKWLVLLALSWLLYDLFDNVVDGIYIGACVGLGYLVTETIVLFAQLYPLASWRTLVYLILIQFAVLGLSSSTLWGALLGASVGLARQNSRRFLQIVAPLIGLVIAICGHILQRAFGLTVFNGVLGSFDAPLVVQMLSSTPPGLIWLAAALSILVTQAPHYVLLALALWYGASWERRIIKDHLHDEVGASITGEEYAALLANRPLRRTARERRIANAQVHLALRKWRLSRRQAESQSDPETLFWRELITQQRSPSRSWPSWR